MNSKSGVTAIIRATDVLKCVGEGYDRVTKISSQTGLSMSTTHRLLKSLELSRLVIGDKTTHRYFLGPLFVQLSANHSAEHKALVTFAMPSIKKLWGIIEETVSLHIRVGLERLSLEEIPSPHVIKHSSGKGDIAPIYAAAAGKVLLSRMDQSDLEMLLKGLELNPIAPNTVTDRAELARQVEETRKKGYATSLSERIPNSASISVPIDNYVCPVALTVFGPEFRFVPNEEYILSETLQIAKEISAKLGEYFQV